MTTSAPVYDRAPSQELQELLSSGGFLAPLVELAGRQVSGHYHDVHFRRNNEVHVYRGHTRLVNAQRLPDGGLDFKADHAYTRQPCAEGFFRHWQTDETGFKDALNHYLSAVKVNPSLTLGEARVQEQWSLVRDSWIPFDREAGLSYGNYANDGEREKARRFDHVAEARIELERHGWGKLPKPGRWLDQLAIDQQGQLVLLELKDAASKSSDGIYYSPFQLLQYVWEWHDALEAVRNGLQAVINARVAVGLTPPSVPPLSGGIRASVGFGPDRRSPEVKRRYEIVLEIVNRHLPDGVGPIETWAFTDTGPILVA